MVELLSQSSFSFLKACDTPQQLVERADSLGYQAICIADEASVAGSVRAHIAGKDLDTHVIHGARFVVTEGWTLVAWVLNADGWPVLCSTISAARRRAEKGDYQIALHQLPQDPNLVWGWLPEHGFLEGVGIQQIQQHFKECYLIAVDHLTGRCAQHLADIDRAAFETQWPVIASSDARMAKRSQKPLLDLMNAIRLNAPLDQLGDALTPNAEACLRAPQEIKERYPQRWIDNASELAQRCEFKLDQLKYRYPSELVPPSYADATQYLAALTWQGAHERWPEGVPARVKALLEKELKLIQELAYEPYFLTVQDVVAFARSQGILCQGRGSAANSAVCFCLFITEVDPARVDVLFERFISKERNEPPDIDVDFEHHRREEVIQYLYSRYGRERAAIAATVITYRPKSAIRDVGRALGMDEGLIKRLSKSLSWWAKPDGLEDYFSEQGIDHTTQRFQLFLHWVREIQGQPRHLSQHVGGFVISDGPLSQWVPIENASMPDRTIVQWDKDDIEALGLLKLDVLALGMLSAIRRSLDVARAWREVQPNYGGDIHPRFELRDIPAEDPATYDMLCEGDSMGVFQVESRAQMSMLPRLRPRSYYDLVIQIALVRPGPIQGDMVHPYLRRRQGLEPINYPNADVQSVLGRTLGVPIFQEQVIQLAMVAAGFSPGEADALRRAMAAWKKDGGLDHFRDKLVDGMLARGHPMDFAERLFEQMKGFGKYGFPESHSASFALLVYVSAWLKCHVPEAFYTGLLNSYPMGFYSPSQLLQEARRKGITILPPDINDSDYDYALRQHQGTTAIRVGLRAIKRLKQESVQQLLLARAQGEFSSLDDLALRSGLSASSLEHLAGAGALDCLGEHRQAARWALADSAWQLPLLAEAGGGVQPHQLKPAAEGQQVLEDYLNLGFTLRTHPMLLLRDQQALQGCMRHTDLADIPDGRFLSLAGLVTGRQRPGSAGGVMFATLEDETGNTNLILWPDQVDRFRPILLTSRLWRVRAQVQHQQGVTHLIVDQLINLDHLLGALPLKNVSYRP